MSILILGLVIFLGAHSARIFADGWRTRTIARVGEKRWKGIYTIVSLIGFVVLCWGFGLARQHPLLLWAPPLALKHANALFTLVAFVLLAASGGPPNRIKATIGHPMVVGVKVWAFGHLLSAGMLHDVVLFGAFFVWAVIDFAVSRRRDRRNGVTYPPGTARATAIAIAGGVVAWALFAFVLHRWLIGVNPFA